MNPMRFGRFGILSLGLLLASCIPFPHNQQESPKIYGQIVNDGVPVANATVSLVVNPPHTETGCPAEAKKTLTDAEGRFTFASTSYFSAFIIFGDRFDSWRICFDKPSGEKAVFDNGAFWGGPPGMDVHCDVKPASDPKTPICSAVERRP